MTLEDKEYIQSKETFTKTQEKALELIVKKEDSIKEIKNEITKILQEHGLNTLDIEDYKRGKLLDRFNNTFAEL
jgi:tRNA(Ser,Leu) C12 N-acetylase TAN1